MYERMLVEDKGFLQMDGGIRVCGLSRCLVGGRGGINGKGEMDRGLESVGFSVCSLWLFPPTVCRDCGLTAHEHRHTRLHTVSLSFG